MLKKATLSFVSHWNSELCNDLKELLDLCFSTQNYMQNLPHVFNAGPTDQWIGLCVDNQLQAFCSLYPLSWLHKTNGLIRAWCVGSVCAHPQARGLGLATAVLEEARARAQLAKCDFLFLFSEMQEFYSRVGYESAGIESFVQFEPDQALLKGSNEHLLLAQGKRLQAIGFEKNRTFKVYSDLGKWEQSRIAHLWQHMCMRGEASESILGFGEFLKMVQIPDMSVALGCKQDALMGSFLVGKGIDFKDVVHGVAVHETADLLWMLFEWRKKNQDLPFTLSAGPWAKGFKKGFEVGFELTQVHSVLLKVPEGARLLAPEIKKMFKRNEIYVRSLHSS